MTQEQVSNLEKDVTAHRSAQSLPDGSSKKPSFGNDGGASSAFVQSFEGLVDHWVGYLVLMAQDFDDDGKNVSRSAAVRVDNVAEVVRVLEVLFKR